MELTKSSGNVFSDIGLPNSDKYLAKAELARQINHIISKRSLKQIDAAKVLGVDQPKISSLSCGRLDDFSIERLIDFLNKLDRDVEIIVKKKPTKRKDHGHLLVAFA
ncbi:helix-turn-helix domain-containing protein [Rickettsiella massiliensis]|uniref:helix-turn-helix domain-containing protein n=1 Tax=Rickettsiella massiliensis TaxID=676517 RepID=UPI00029B45F3|nr:helix-turn-helix transcriptional regulator [Rickettsiella massiliensis]